MYEVEATGAQFHSFLAAVAAANTIRSNVIEVDTGKIRWTPPPEATALKKRKYYDSLAAYAAQERGKK